MAKQTTIKSKPIKVPVTFKCDPDLLDQFERFRETLDFPVTLTGFIEQAMRREFERQRGAAKHK